MDTKILVKLDCDSIHEYIFHTSKLRQIQQSSEIIDDMIFEYLPHEMGADTINPPTLLDGNIRFNEIIIQGGGTLLVEYALIKEISEDVIEGTMNDLMERLCFFYRENTYGATLTGEWIKYDREGQFLDALKELNQKVARKKGIPKIISLLPGGSFLKRCDCCGLKSCDFSNNQIKQVQSIDNPLLDKKVYLCSGCANNEERYRKQKNKKDDNTEKKDSAEKGQAKDKIGTKGLLVKKKRWPGCWAKFAICEEWKKMGKEYREYLDRRPDEFEDMVKDEREGDKWLGLIYFDGNGMGETIDNYLDESENIKGIQISKRKDALKQLSDKVDEVLHRSVVETLSTLFSYPKDKEKAPFNKLILGGDDLVLLIKCRQVCYAAVQIIQKFEQYTKDSGFPMTASAGIVFFHYKYPISNAIHAAKELLKNAKRHACEEDIKKDINGVKKPGSTIDFVVLSDPGTENPETYRKKIRKHVPGFDESIEEPYLFCRPYSISAFSNLIVKIENIKKGKSLLSGSRLNRLRQAVLAGRSKAIYVTLHTIVHGTSSDMQQNLKDILISGGGRQSIDKIEYPYILEKIGDKKRKIRRTVVLDIVDLFPFVNSDMEKIRI